MNKNPLTLTAAPDVTNAAEDTTNSDVSRDENGLITPANLIQFLMAIFVRLFELISGALS